MGIFAQTLGGNMSRFSLFLAAFSLFFLPALAHAQGAAPTYVNIETSFGPIVLELDNQTAPNTAANFAKNVQNGHYDGTIFHRVIGNFMIQGGGFTPDMKEKPTGPEIQNEATNGLKNMKYTVAMARTGDPHSAAAQFFINTVDNPGLDHTAETPQGWGYAVFGKVVKGQDTVDQIAKVKTGRFGPHENVPVKPVIIEKATIIAQP